uniref:Uncharacterized protein n=1 Tax=Nelumbo nucifera TaxID=4432 RepID=A0A822YTR7_NELNU|nr:TPA_asm: hypothetical protein HUJ06_008145 [Nelumbo nucifera]
MIEEGKSKGLVGDRSQPQQQYYGTFQGVPNYSQPAMGFPQPVPPPGASAPSAPLYHDSSASPYHGPSAPPYHGPSAPPYHLPPAPAYYAHGYQTVPGYAIAEGRPIRERRLPCCGIGCGWFLPFLLPLQLLLVQQRGLSLGDTLCVVKTEK